MITDNRYIKECTIHYKCILGLYIFTLSSSLTVKFYYLLENCSQAETSCRFYENYMWDRFFPIYSVSDLFLNSVQQ